MKVLMICPELPSADSPGSMAPAARQIQSLRDLGLEIDVVDMRGIPMLKYMQAIPRVRKLAKQADVVHCHFGYCGWLGKMATWLGPKKPIVMSFMGDDLLGTPYNPQGDLEWFSKVMVRANRRLAKSLSQIIVKSPEMARVLDPVSSTVIPNGVNTQVFRPIPTEEARRQLNLELDKKYVLFPGNPENPRKGFALASESVARAQALHGEEIEILKLWNIEPDQVSLYMNAADSMLMTSLIEGSPNVVKEALACDTPVIGVPVGDVEDLLKGVEGCFFCDRSPEQIGEAIVESFQLECEGRRAIFDRGLDLESVARRILSIYERALGQDNRAVQTHDVNRSPLLPPPNATFRHEVSTTHDPQDDSVAVGGPSCAE